MQTYQQFNGNWGLSVEIKADPSKYHPISLLSIFNRIFEKTMYCRLMAYLEINGILCDSQYGFREKHSTEHALVDIVNQGPVVQNPIKLILG